MSVVREAVECFKDTYPDILVGGEFQLDVAVFKGGCKA